MSASATTRAASAVMSEEVPGPIPAMHTQCSGAIVSACSMASSYSAI